MKKLLIALLLVLSFVISSFTFTSTTESIAAEIWRNRYINTKVQTPRKKTVEIPKTNADAASAQQTEPLPKPILVEVSPKYAGQVQTNDEPIDLDVIETKIKPNETSVNHENTFAETVSYNDTIAEETNDADSNVGKVENTNIIAGHGLSISVTSTVTTNTVLQQNPETGEPGSLTHSIAIQANSVPETKKEAALAGARENTVASELKSIEKAIERATDKTIGIGQEFLQLAIEQAINNHDTPKPLPAVRQLNALEQGNAIEMQFFAEAPVEEEPEVVESEPIIEEPTPEPVEQMPSTAESPPPEETEVQPDESEPVVEETKTAEPAQEEPKPEFENTAPQKPETPFISETPEKLDDTTRLLRYPDVWRFDVVFCYAGDLWTVKTKGGIATRLTAHEGLELFPKYSPDGSMIAFTGQYDGDEQVYVMPSTGGTPRQLTFYPAAGPFPPRRGYDNIVYGWTPDGKSVLFRSVRDSNSVTELGTLYTISVDGGLPVKLPMPTAGAGDFSPDGKQMVYSPLFRDFRSWKRYEGGWAQDLAIFDLATSEFKKIAVTPRTERDPMWVGDNIFFVSDRDATLNLYKYDTKTGKIDKITNSTTWDVRWASSDEQGKIVYELGGELKLYNIESGEIRDIPIQVPHDGLAMRPSRYDVSKNIESLSLAPGGKRAAIVARGDVFSVPAEKGAARNLTQTSGAHDREAEWSPDGSKIAFISDGTGENQIYLVDQKGESKPEMLTDCFATQLDNLAWSPDGKFVSVTESGCRLYIVPLETDESIGVQKGVPVEVAKEANGGSPSYSWAPCGKFLAVVLSEESGFGSIYVWDVKTRQLHRITGPNTDEFSPTWDPKGNYLYYLARHEFSPQFSSVEWNYAGNRNTGVYALALRKDVANLFAPQSDEVEVKRDDAKKDEKKDDKDKSKEDAKSKETVIDFDGLADRVVRVPLSFENYSRLQATEKFLYYIQSGAGFYGREPYENSSIRAYDLKERKETTYAENAGSYSISPDGTKIIFSSRGQVKIANSEASSQSGTNVPTGDLAVDRIPSQEWEEVFNETCRKFRDFFYVKNMHGYDWKAICDQYRTLLPHVAHRSDLNYVLSEMVSELNVGHAYIQGGDFIVPKRAKVALPGARFELDTASNRYKIAKIFKGDNHEPKYRSPLTEIGVNISVGDFVLEIDGHDLIGNDNPYRLLQNKTNPVTLTVNDKPELEGARKVVFQPLDNESSLLYLDFITDRMERVNKATDGRIGYIHIPDMGAPGAYEFIKWYYPQIRKEGLVIDVRSNGGGNISQWIIMRLSQKLLGTRFGSGRENAQTYPYTVFAGQLVCLINETSASDGDIFPYYFRKSGLGPLIGKRSWGGVVGISSRGSLIDGAQVMVPLSATNEVNGDYIIEGEGVTPDIEVDNDPKSVIEGKDIQLERGIAEVLSKVESTPKVFPPQRPDDPVKTKEAVKKY